MSKLLILDGNNLLIRAIHAPVEYEMKRKDGLVTGPLYRALNMTFRSIRENQPTHFLCVFDHGKSAYRAALRPEYKANRREPDDELRAQRKEELLTQLRMYQDAISNLFMTYVSEPKVEADDIIAAACQHYPGNKVVLSDDHDLLQLVSSSVIIQKSRRTPNGEPVFFDISAVQEKYELMPDQLVPMWALTGDKGDNIIGLNRVGEKTARKALNTHGFDFNAAVSALAKTPEGEERVLGNLDLIYLHPELSAELPSFDGIELDYEFLLQDLKTVAETYEFTSFLNRGESILRK